MQTFNACHRPWNKSTYINRQVWLSLISDNYPPGCCFCNVCWKQTIKVRLDIFKILDVLYWDFDIFETLKQLTPIKGFPGHICVQKSSTISNLPSAFKIVWEGLSANMLLLYGGYTSNFWFFKWLCVLPNWNNMVHSRFWRVLVGGVYQLKHKLRRFLCSWSQNQTKSNV